MTVLTFTSYVPPARTGEPWNRARIEESGAEAGPYVTLETVSVAPLDDDARYPRPRTFSTEDATPGRWYRVVWLDATDDESAPTDPRQWIVSMVDEVRPAVQDVADLIIARTKATGNRTLRMFTDETPVTAEEVERHIDAASGLVLARVGAVPQDEDCTSASTIRSGIRTLIAMRAALFIEPSNWPEQTGDNRSAYDALWTQWLEDVKAVAAAAAACREGEDSSGPDATVGPADAAWWFPPDAGGLVGWGTRW